MTEITEIKKTIEYARTDFRAQLTFGGETVLSKADLLTLITTIESQQKENDYKSMLVESYRKQIDREQELIDEQNVQIESQKEEIEKYEQRVWKEQLQLGESVNFRLAQDQIESLKAITELAVTCLQRIDSIRETYPTNFQPYQIEAAFIKAERLTTNALEEIARIQNDRN